MARVIAVLASPGSNDNPLRLNYEMEAPRAASDAAIEMFGEDAEYACRRWCRAKAACRASQ
jgi:hypothetical protein